MRPFFSATLGLACLLGSSLVLAQGQTSSPKNNQAISQRSHAIASSSSANAAETTLGYVEPYGFVRDTPAALASLTHPLSPAPGRNDLVAACRAMVEKSAEAHGAEWVEAVSAGPHAGCGTAPWPRFDSGSGIQAF